MSKSKSISQLSNLLRPTSPAITSSTSRLSLIDFATLAGWSILVYLLKSPVLFVSCRKKAQCSSGVATARAASAKLSTRTRAHLEAASVGSSIESTNCFRRLACLFGYREAESGPARAPSAGGSELVVGVDYLQRARLRPATVLPEFPFWLSYGRECTPKRSVWADFLYAAN